MLVGYARVSTQEQETHAQTDALAAAGCDKIFSEKRSGGSLSRPILFECLESLRPGDVFVVYKLDRVARSLRDLLDVISTVQARGAGFKSLTEVIDTSTPAGNMMLQIIGAFAEFERALIRERTVVGMKAAKERGAVFGAPKALTDEQEAEMVVLWGSGHYTKTALAKMYGTHISSIKRAIRRQAEKMQPGLL